MNISITQPQIFPDDSDFFYKSIVYGLTVPLLILTVFGNGIILITIIFQARLLSSICNYFILSLASADFFVGILVMPYMILYTANKNGQWLYGQTLCDFWMSIDFLCSSASFLTLSVMSIERYKMLTTSYVSIKNSSKTRVLAFICISWLLPFLTWIPVIVGFRYRDTILTTICVIPASKYLVLCLCVLLYHIPLVCMVTFYIKLIIHIKNTSPPIQDEQVIRYGRTDNSVHVHKTGQVSVGADSKPRFVAAIKLNKSNTHDGASYSNNSYADNYLKDKSSKNTVNNNNSNHEIEALHKTPFNHHAYNSSKRIRNTPSLFVPAKIQFAESSNKFCHHASLVNSPSHHIKIFENSTYQKIRLKRNRKAARMLGFLVAAFSICWLPYCVTFPISQFFPDLIPYSSTFVIWWLGYMNSAINPFLYVYSNKNIRKSVRSIFCNRIVYSCVGRNQRIIEFRKNSLKAKNNVVNNL